MSTKINVRSPFYLNLTEPVAPTPLFQCGTADIQNLTIDQQGQINQPTTALGTVLSITSSDSDFSNDKFATVTTATDRDLTVRVSIPALYSNSADGYIDCDKTVEQPALIVTQPTPSDPPVTCSGGPTTNGSIPAVSIDSGGDSDKGKPKGGGRGAKGDGRGKGLHLLQAREQQGRGLGDAGRSDRDPGLHLPAQGLVLHPRHRQLR